MFEVEMYENNYSWGRLIFNFETLEEAQGFVASAINHFVQGDDDGEYLIVNLRYAQNFTSINVEGGEK